MSDATRSDDLRRHDAEARRLAQTEFVRPMVLEAGAGTGKTTALVARVLAWGLGAGWDGARVVLAEAASTSDVVEERPDRIAARVLSRVVAITFTEAAAAEMSTRLGDALHEVETGQTPLGLLDDGLPEDAAERRRRARALRGALDHLVVQTIHAWCRRLLVTHPIDAGVHPELEVDADGRIRQEVVRERIEERLQIGYAEESSFLELALLGVGPQELETEVNALLDAGFTARDFEDDPLSDARLGVLGSELTDAVGDFARAHGGALRGLSRGQVADLTLGFLEGLAGRLAESRLADRTSLAALSEWVQSELDPRAAKRIHEWAKGKFNKGETAAVGDDADPISQAAARVDALLRQLTAMDVALLDHGCTVFGELLSDVESELRARGVATFASLLEGAARLLTGHPEVAARVRGGIDQLLVDEFQDTDRRQCAMVRSLALEGPEDTRPGLFIVGDPKQSIYGWRSADLAAYDDFVAGMLDQGGVPARLSVNYRSVPAILDEVERVIAPVMEEARGIQPAFQPLVASEGRAGDSGYSDARSAPVEYSIPATWDPEERAPARAAARETARLESAGLARDLRRLHDEAGVAWRDFGVLFRSRSDWDLYLGALRNAGIPFSVEGDRNYFRRREIVDASALVRCVLDPGDLVALVTLLRSAMVGVPDAALVPLWSRDLPGQLLGLHAPDREVLDSLRASAHEVASSLPEGIPGLARVAGWEHNLVAALEAIAALRESAHRDPADVFVERLRISLLIEPTESARYQGPWRGANLDRFFRDLLQDLDEGGDFHRVLRRLRSAVAESVDAEEGRPREVLEDAVQIMTIHGAKGLDFVHVYLMQCHKGAGGGFGTRVDSGRVDGRLEYSVLGAPTPGWHRVLAEREVRESAERVRTLYVALTRARDRLVISGLWPDVETRKGSGRAIDLIVQRAAGVPDLRQALEGVANAEGAACIDAAEVRWVFPGVRVEDAAPVDGAGPAAAGLPDVETIAEASRTLRDHRDAARRHMERPLVGAATLDAHENSDEEIEERMGEGPPGIPAWRGGEDDGVARAVGTAVHRALEHFDFEADLEEELVAAQSHLARSIEAELGDANRDRALKLAGEMLGRIAAGPLMARLRELASRIIARELPVLVGPSSEGGPVACVTGAIDLVYRDPDSDELVVADYKTGARHDYRSQGAHYRRALRDALHLDYEPRFELWYLEEGEIVAE